MPAPKSASRRREPRSPAVAPRFVRLLPLAALAIVAGCASYRTPGAAFRFDEAPVGAPNTGAARLNAPVSIAVARVQASGYRSYSAQAYGVGAYSVLAIPSADGDGALAAIGRWPGVAGVALIDSALLPASLGSLDDLRFAAAKQGADVLFVYSVETRFDIGGTVLPPQSPLQPGKAPDGAIVHADAQAQFIDVRTGQLDGVAAGSTTLADLAASWATPQALDGKRLDAERAALTQLLGDAARSWTALAGPGAR
ncbi:MAG: hypothetical protein QM661_08570 [Solimonas sp.]